MFVVIGMSLVLIALGIVAYENSAGQKLKRAGYSNDEIDLIIERTEKSDLASLFEQNYDPRVAQIIASDEFQRERFSAYLQAMRKYGFEAEDLVFLINHPDYRPEESYTPLLLEILRADYYLSKNRERYFAYADTLATQKAAEGEIAAENPEPEKTLAEQAGTIVALVNSNRDYEFYTETSPTDTQDEKLMLVNKYYYLEPDYDVDLVQLDARYGESYVTMERETYEHFEQMFAAALQDGIQLYVTSGYRNYADQEEVFASYLAEGDEAYALLYAAKPGFSEHQTGRAIDVFTPGMTLTSFAGTVGANWLRDEAYKYGFILRYPETKEDLTGYSFEPWHYRYVGKDAAEYIFTHDLTLEEYYAFMVQKDQ